MEEVGARDIGQAQETEISEEERNQLNTIENILTRLSITCKSRSLYPADHPTVREAVQMLHSMMADVLAYIPYISLRVGQNSLLYGQRPLQKGTLRPLASRMRSLRIQEISFDADLTQQEVEMLVELLVLDPEALEAEGGAETFILARGAHGLNVIESEAQRADDKDAPKGESPGEATALEDSGMATATIGTSEIMEELLEREVSDEERGFLELLLNPIGLANLLVNLAGEKDPPPSKEELAEAIFQFLKSASSRVEEIYMGLAPSCFRSMAEALLFLQIDLRNLLLGKRLIPGVSQEPVCASILGQFNTSEIADVLSYFFPAAPEFIPETGGLLKAIGFEDQEVKEALNLIKNKLVDLGEVPPTLIATLEDDIEVASKDAPMAHELPDLDKIFASLNEYSPQEIEAIHRLTEFDLPMEALLDMTPVLLDLLNRGAKLDNIGRALEMLQHNFWDLVGSVRLGLAATALEGMISFLKNSDPAIDPYRLDLKRLVHEAESDKALHRIIRFAYDQRDDPESVEGFRRYIRVLGDRGIVALIEALGSEEDMSLRKYLIEILAEQCRDKTHILGAYVNDPRWFLVRNVVNIMARLHSPDTLPYLRQTLSHPNPKVRMETVRALGSIGGSQATEIITTCLQSMDETTCISGIRWLAKINEPRTVDNLTNMLEGKEPGAESLRIKKEIIIRLGEIGTPDTCEVLMKYSTRQKLLNRSEWQEINRAARESLDRLLAKYPHLRRLR